MSERAEWAKDENFTIRHAQIDPRFATGEAAALLVRDTCRRFHDLMDAAMQVSGFKYGAVADAYPHNVRACAITEKEAKAKYPEACSLEKRLALYRQTGNTEYLVDVANFAMIEFMHPRHAKAHYTPTDSTGSPGRSNIAGLPQMNNAGLATVAND